MAGEFDHNRVAIEHTDNSVDERPTHKLRAALTAVTVEGWANVDYVALIAAGTALEHQGVNGWLAGQAIAAAAVAETYAMSKAAETGMGNFTFDLENATTRTGISRSAPVISLWRGAPSGVMMDKAMGKEVDTKRRLLHAVPYGLAIGELWVAPNPLRQEIISLAKPVVHDGEALVASHPLEGVGLVAGVFAAIAGSKFRRLRRQRQQRSTEQDFRNTCP